MNNDHETEFNNESMGLNLEEILPQTERNIFADKQGFNESQAGEGTLSYDTAAADPLLSEQDTRAVAIQVLLQNASIRGEGYVSAGELIQEADLVTRYLATGHTPESAGAGSPAASDPDLG